MERLGDPLGLRFRERYGTWESRGPLQGLLNARNDSLLAHGTVPISEDKARGLHKQLRALAEVADPEICNRWLPMAELPEFRPF